MTLQEREDLMVTKYGEVCSQAAAARIISRAPNTIKAMLNDGRLDAACGGVKVDVRSIARYIMSPKQEDFKARNVRAGRKWVVA